MSVDREARLQERLSQERSHLATGHDPHFHVVVWTDNENEWERVRFISSPPFREQALAEHDAGDPGLRENVDGLHIDVVACDRACPRSGLGHFGYEEEDKESPAWLSWWGRRRY